MSGHVIWVDGLPGACAVSRELVAFFFDPEEEIGYAMRRGEFGPGHRAENYRQDPLFWAETRRLVLRAVSGRRRLSLYS